MKDGSAEAQVTENGGPTSIEGAEKSLLSQFPHLTFVQRQSLSCDSAFALYLCQVAKCVNLDYYKTVIRFVLLYRQALNEVGWLRRRDHVLRCGW